MARDLRSLAGRMRKLNRRLEFTAGKITREAASIVVDVLVDRTPIDTTKAVSNWQVGINRPVRTIIPPHFPGKLKSTEYASTRETKNLAEEKIKEYVKHGVIYVSNHVPYIQGLNNGTISAQASGFVEAAVVSAQLRLQNLKINVSGLVAP